MTADCVSGDSHGTAAPYLRMTTGGRRDGGRLVLSFRGSGRLVLSFRGSEATERILPFCHSEAKAEESHGRTVGLRSWDASHSFSMTVRTIEKKGNKYDKKA